MIIFGESHSLWVWGALLAMIIGLVLVKPNHDDAETAEWPEKARPFCGRRETSLPAGVDLCHVMAGEG